MVYDGPIASALAATSRLEITRELRRLGWPVTLVAEGPSGVHRVRGVEVTCLPRPRVYFLGTGLFHLALLRFVLQRLSRFEAVLFHQMSAPWLLSLRGLCRLLGWDRPLLVMDTRDMDPREGTLRNRLRRWFFHTTHWLANRWADGQTAITPRMAELVGIPSAQLWGIWPSGVQLDRFAPAQHGRRWPVNGEPIQLIYIGKMRLGCKLLPLCQAVERANAGDMRFVLSLIGEGPERSSLEEFALGTEGRIRVGPAIPHEQVPELLRHAHVGVTALFSPDDRLFAASSPLKLFEYMAAGLPILSTRSPCYTDVVGAGTYAFWAESPNQEGMLSALHSVWLARAVLSEKGHQAAAAARDWTWQAAAKKLSNALAYGLVQGGVQDHG